MSGNPSERSVGGEAESSGLEVTRLLGASQSLLLLLLFGEASAGSLRQPGTEILRGLSLLGPLLLLLGSALLVDDGEDLRDALSNNLKNKVSGQEVKTTISSIKENDSDRQD